MTPDDGDRLKADLHRIFDSQIATFGSYNLIYGHGSVDYPGTAPGSRRDFIVGYCMKPVEVVFAPFLLPDLTPVEPAIAVNATNLVHAGCGGGSRYEVETNVGVRVGVTVPGRVRLTVGGRPRWLEQEEDAEDFTRFMAERFANL
ncbi:hypothetical protein BKD30_01785 [Tersicoccus phoenicis]|uniref:Uncharacterized protein n=1 Tax=Tersicoccus phoenicis TaxID=554083 RepID=A0A1R1LL69_9MICC|nr:hypothetical protein [Tersicoccus phoenicis]OMH28273.1 hypothetical protein BKD30_01785 [Tersicoccus phoenicis]